MCAGFGQLRIEPTAFWGSSQAHPPTTNSRLGPKILVMGSLLHHTGTRWAHVPDQLQLSNPPTHEVIALAPLSLRPPRDGVSGENFLCPGLSASLLWCLALVWNSPEVHALLELACCSSVLTYCVFTQLFDVG